MNLVDIMLQEIYQSPKGKWYMTSLKKGRVVKFIETEYSVMVTGAGAREEWRVIVEQTQKKESSGYG